MQKGNKMANNTFSDPIIYRQNIKLKYADLVWELYLHQDIIKRFLDKEYFGSLNSIVQLFLQYVVKEWACPNCLQIILPFMENCIEVLPPNGDIVYVYSKEYICRFPVLFCPHCLSQIVVIATNEYSELFEFKYRLINGVIFNLDTSKILTTSEIKNLGLIIRKS